MEGCKHFSHPHKRSFHKVLEVTCTACFFVLAAAWCTRVTLATSSFTSHDQCHAATRSLIHTSHPAHPFTLYPSPTYTSGSFICNSCNQTRSGLRFACSIREFDLHVHCAYNDLNPNSSITLHQNRSILKRTRTTPCTITPNHLTPVTHSCDVCGAHCDDNSVLYRCDICDYNAHLGCINLAEAVQREDHGHNLSLLHMNPFKEFECDVCRCMIMHNYCMYFCTSGCNYGMQVKCVAKKVVPAVEVPTDEMTFQIAMLKLQGNRVRYKCGARLNI